MAPLLTFGLTFLLSLGFVPLARWLGLRLGLVAEPRPDRWHREPTSFLGGAGMFAAFGLALLAAALFNQAAERQRWGLLAGSAAAFLLGLYDDLKPLAPLPKLAGQILASTAVIALGLTTHFFSPRLADPTLALVGNVLLSYAWLVGITNAFNLLDNMDGLAAGVGLIAASILSFFFWRAGETGLLHLSLAAAGSALSFLAFNFPPASVFMGDSGSQFLGFTLAALAIARQPQASNVFAVAAVPALLFLLPILDIALVTITRLLRGQSPAQGGRDHTSHRLVAFGFSERQAVLLLYGVALLSGVLAAALESLAYWFSLAVVPLLVLCLAVLAAYLGGLQVVEAAPTPARAGAISRLLSTLAYRRRALEVALDFVVIGLACYLAIVTLNGARLGDASLELYRRMLPAALAGATLAAPVSGLYGGAPRPLGRAGLARCFAAALGAGALFALAFRLFYPTGELPAAVFPLFALYLFLGLAAISASFQLLDGLARRRRRQRVLVLGLGEAGEAALRWLAQNPRLAYRPIGILGEGPLPVERRVEGVEALGGLEELESALDRLQADGVIVARASLQDDALLEKALPICRRKGCWVRSLGPDFELAEVS